MGFHTELHTFVFLSPDDRPEIRFMEGNDAVLKFGGRIFQQKLLLDQDFFDGLQAGKVIWSNPPP